MRAYQLQGLNWMVSLHHNGLNGILADEMVCLLNASLAWLSSTSYNPYVGPRQDPSIGILPRIPQTL